MDECVRMFRIQSLTHGELSTKLVPSYLRSRNKNCGVESLAMEGEGRGI